MRITMLILALASSAIASAQEAPEAEARSHAVAGSTAYSSGDYAEAIKEYSQAYKLVR